VLVVNTATKCGFTPQYDGLQDIYEKYKAQGFEILDFPCDQFAHQAPGSGEEIAAFCDAKFGITFTHFEKVDVNGENAHPLFQYLKSQKGFEGFASDHPLFSMLESMLGRVCPNYKESPDIKWNFTKFLIDRQGNVVQRFEPTADLDDVARAIEELLA